ncbi:MAG: prepilin-type N-terminal cleavage/methylation domain-containing protein [Armatimonadetes bacterium]|nr:prepilin-type N-terminal cleavage/methylation domain-containing protein [Armatimonadota bacterium]
MARFRTTSRKPYGFTLVEVLVVAFITLLLTLVLVAEYTQSAAAVDMATSRVEMQQVGRRVLDRLTPYLSSAVDRGSIPAVDFPNINQFDPTEYIIFNSTENFLAPGYDPRVIPPLGFFDGLDYPTFTYVVWFEDDAVADPAVDIDQNDEDNVVMLGRLIGAYDRNNPFPSLDPTVDPVVLARGNRGPERADGAELVNVEFRRRLTNAIEISVTTRAQFREAHGNRREDDTTLVSVVQLPSQTTR